MPGLLWSELRVPSCLWNQCRWWPRSKTYKANKVCETMKVKKKEVFNWRKKKRKEARKKKYKKKHHHCGSFDWFRGCGFGLQCWNDFRIKNWWSKLGPSSWLWTANEKEDMNSDEDAWQRRLRRRRYVSCHWFSFPVIL